MKVKSDHDSKFSNLSNLLELENLLRWSLFTFNIYIICQQILWQTNLLNSISFGNCDKTKILINGQHVMEPYLNSQWKKTLVQEIVLGVWDMGPNFQWIMLMIHSWAMTFSSGKWCYLRIQGMEDSETGSLNLTHHYEFTYMCNGSHFLTIILANPIDT